MTNNYEENILRGVRNSSYSLESSIELLQKDVVQLHAPRYQSMRRVRLKPSKQGIVHKQMNMQLMFCCFFCKLVTGCDRLHTRDGFYPLASQRHREDCLPAVLQMERS